MMPVPMWARPLGEGLWGAGLEPARPYLTSRWNRIVRARLFHVIGLPITEGAVSISSAEEQQP